MTTTEGPRSSSSNAVPDRWLSFHDANRITEQLSSGDIATGEELLSTARTVLGEEATIMDGLVFDLRKPPEANKYESGPGSKLLHITATAITSVATLGEATELIPEIREAVTQREAIEAEAAAAEAQTVTLMQQQPQKAESMTTKPNEPYNDRVLPFLLPLSTRIQKRNDKEQRDFSAWAILATWADLPASLLFTVGIGGFVVAEHDPKILVTAVGAKIIYNGVARISQDIFEAARKPR